MTGYEFRDLILVRLLTDQSTTKRQPVVVNNDAYHRAADLVILRSRARCTPSPVSAGRRRSGGKGLIKPSVLKPVLATIERSLVLRNLGRLEEEDRHTLREVLRAILGE